MSKETDDKKENIEEKMEEKKEENKKKDENISQIKKIRKEKRGAKKSKTLRDNNVKVVPLLKSPSRRRKFDKDGKKGVAEKSHNSIIWDNKTIEEQYLDRKLHPRIKIDEPKTPYPNGDENDVYEEGINKLNEIKPTEEILNEVVASLNEKDKISSNTKELKLKAYGNEYTNALKFYNENKEKFDDLSGERKMCLKNTLINKFHKEVRSFSKGKHN